MRRAAATVAIAVTTDPLPVNFPYAPEGSLSLSDSRWYAFGHGLALPLLVAALALAARFVLRRAHAPAPPPPPPDGGHARLVGEVLPSPGDATERFDLRLDGGEVVAVTHQGLLRRATAMDEGHLTGDDGTPAAWPRVGDRVVVEGFLSEAADAAAPDGYRGGGVRSLRPRQKALRAAPWPVAERADLRDARAAGWLAGLCVVAVVAQHATLLRRFDRALREGVRAEGALVEGRRAWREGEHIVRGRTTSTTTEEHCTLRVTYRDPDGTERFAEPRFACPPQRVPDPADPDRTLPGPELTDPVPLFVVPGAPELTQVGRHKALEGGRAIVASSVSMSLGGLGVILAAHRWRRRRARRAAEPA
jgi:hypothetical protein